MKLTWPQIFRLGLVQMCLGAVVGVKAGDVLASASVALASSGTSVTLAKLGVYDTSGNQLAATADFAASTTSGAPKRITVAFAAAYTVPADTAVYAVFLNVNSSAGPTLYRGGSLTATDTAVGSGAHGMVLQGAQTDLQATHTFAKGGFAPWIGLS